MSEMWTCTTCEIEFDSTWSAIDHTLRCDQPYIWPIYNVDD